MDLLSILSLVRLAWGVGESLYRLYDGVGLAVREFETFNREVTTLATLWSHVQRCVQNPGVGLTNSLISSLNLMIRDTRIILEDLRQTVEDFSTVDERKYTLTRQHKILRIRTSPDQQRHQRIRKFLNRDRIATQRSELLFATATLNVILGVIRHSELGPPHGDSRLQPAGETLVDEQRRARRRVAALESQDPESPVVATAWLDPLPQPPSRHATFEILARQWTTNRPPQPQAWQRDNRDNTNIMSYVAPLQRRIAELERQRQEEEHNIAEMRALFQQQHESDMNEIRKMSARVERIEQECRRLQNETEEQRKTIDELDHECDLLEMEVESLRADRDRYREQRNKYRRDYDLLVQKLPPTSFPTPAARSRRSSGSSRTSSTYVDSSRPSSKDGRPSSQSSSIRLRLF
ncbi:hypothetical protein PV08_00659 [Exophiala spinifera]|uniref:Fungal N-terminal domain-containing protein n=1 Tax=Exophiala spinifera TaxID=91928 RepID=A0A0D2C956_9EURO|nr:uncharacterized protein PV08_00659 [Exophiala spinifera]KIW20084.1 hypothetical protein PV08_00659 [Exophiala spinifera]